MKKEHLKTNTMYYSKRYGCICQCLQVRDFFAYLLFVDKERTGWYPCSEIEYDFYDEEGKPWGDFKI